MGNNPFRKTALWELGRQKEKKKRGKKREGGRLKGRFASDIALV